MEGIERIKNTILEYEVIIASIVILLLVILGAWFFLVPNLTRIQEIISKQDELSKRLVKLEKKDKTLSAIDEKMYSTNFPKLTQVLSESKDYVSLFFTLDKLENKTNASIIRTDFQLGVISTPSGGLVKDKVSNAYKLPMNIEVTGSFEQIKDFLKAIQDLSGRLITVDEIGLIYKESGVIQAQLKANAFFYPFPKSISSIDSSLKELTSSYQKIYQQIVDGIELSQIETKKEDIQVGKNNLFE